MHSAAADAAAFFGTPYQLLLCGEHFEREDHPALVYRRLSGILSRDGRRPFC